MTDDDKLTECAKCNGTQEVVLSWSRIWRSVRTPFVAIRQRCRSRPGSRPPRAHAPRRCRCRALSGPRILRRPCTAGRGPRAARGRGTQPGHSIARLRWDLRSGRFGPDPVPRTGCSAIVSEILISHSSCLAALTPRVPRRRGVVARSRQVRGSRWSSDGAAGCRRPRRSRRPAPWRWRSSRSSLPARS